MTGPETMSSYCDNEWWRDHYSGAMLDLWQSIVPPGQAIEDTGFIIGQLDLHAGSKVLDVPCGEGRVAIELASRGMRMTGVDISAGQIAAARQKAASRGVDADWHVGDMRCLPGSAPFDAAICWGDSFGYMDEAGNRAFLEAVNRVLIPGGRWAMEMQMVAEVVLPRLQMRAQGRAGEFSVSVRRAYDPGSRRLSVEYGLERAGVRETRSASYRIHSCDEICALLAAAGFRVDRLCARDGSPFSADADRLRVVATAVSRAA